jgi:hypothetical protein
MPRVDLLGVNAPWFKIEVSQAIDDPVVRQKIVDRLILLRREAEHAIQAIDTLRLELSRPKPSTSQLLPVALKQSRDWVLSVVMSQVYVCTMFYDHATFLPGVPFTILFTRAVKAGEQLGTQDPERRRANRAIRKHRTPVP